jgi:hypothetical protein
MNKLITAFLFAICLSATAQTPLLERKITLSLNNETLEVSLQKISQAGGFTFSYNPAVVDAGRTVTYHFVDRSVRQVLDEIFKGTLKYKARGKYIILTSGDRNEAKAEPAIVTGYVVDEATGERLKDVSIYDPVTLTSTITDSYGYFEIKIDRPPEDIILSVNRENYIDTLVAVDSRERLLNIPVRINKEKLVLLADSVGHKISRFWQTKVRSLQTINMINIDDTLYRATQVSVVPFFGTNHRLSGRVINDYSFNIFGGYSLGVTTLEIGGLFNLESGNVEGAQFAGLFNNLGGRMTGVQFAGLFNLNRRSFRGAQFAGVINIDLDDAEGAQFGGVGNVVKGRQKGPQFGGVFNVTTGEHYTSQFAGVFNIAAKNMSGVQGSGVFNIAGKNMRGTQVAGVMNVAGKEMRGAQIAGVLNVARRIRGTQLGLINISDSIRGIPIGLVSIVGKGYHKIEVAADEIFYTNLSFRTGVHAFYNIFTAGAKPSTYKLDETFWTFGYGIGTAPRVARKLFLNIDLTANQIVYGNTIEAINLLNKMYVGFDYQAFKKISLTFGATLNGYLTRTSFEGYEPLFTDYRPDIFYSRDVGQDHHLSMWIGGKVGLRFL